MFFPTKRGENKSHSSSHTTSKLRWPQFWQIVLYVVNQLRVSSHLPDVSAIYVVLVLVCLSIAIPEVRSAKELALILTARDDDQKINLPSQ